MYSQIISIALRLESVPFDNKDYFGAGIVAVFSFVKPSRPLDPQPGIIHYIDVPI